VTSDQIPILWTRELRRYLETENALDSTVAANVATYERISETYRIYRRPTDIRSRRLRAGAVRLLGETVRSDGNPECDRPLHLDFGCGPGHVIEALSPLGYRHVGFDVSLQNLRSTRRWTGAAVVLGDATRMPFADDTFDLVTESGVLHHIEDWRSAVTEACRVSRRGVILDSEPSNDNLDWGRIARIVFEMRFPVFKLLSYVDESKSGFRDLKKARLNARSAEIHNQPGKGFDIGEVASLMDGLGFDADPVLSPDERMETGGPIGRNLTVLHLLSGHNPKNPKYGVFSVLGRAGAVTGRYSGPPATTIRGTTSRPFSGSDGTSKIHDSRGAAPFDRPLA
jgi:SAM-dependent methyltransferase